MKVISLNCRSAEEFPDVGQFMSTSSTSSSWPGLCGLLDLVGIGLILLASTLVFSTWTFMIFGPNLVIGLRSFFLEPFEKSYTISKGEI